MPLNLRYYGDPVLRKKCSSVMEITPDIRQLVTDMIETMKENNGIGLAAPQVGISLRVFITQVPKEGEDGEWVDGDLRVYINPEIVEYSEEKSCYTEACLSIPGVNADVERPLCVKTKAQDIEGNTFTTETFGLEAHCVLHENDHINGVLFIDRVRGKVRKLLDSKLKKVKQEYYLQQK